MVDDVVFCSGWQVALVDVLTAIGVKADGMLGHSIGELGCAYADGCLTAEQTILTAYYRGEALRHTNFIRGSMASIGKRASFDLRPSTLDSRRRTSRRASCGHGQN